MKLQNVYSWEIELRDGSVSRQYENGKEQTWKKLRLDEIVRVSFVPVVNILPRHDCFIDISHGEHFIKRFGKGFIKQMPDGFRLAEYVNCCQTNRYRFWVFHSNGRCLITRPDFELRI